MMNILRTLIAIAALVPVAALAQNPYHGNVDRRQAEQHRRIVQGVHSGRLTPREARDLRAREAAIRAQERRARLSHGHLSPRERARLNRELNHTSRHIDVQKHDRDHRHPY